MTNTTLAKIIENGFNNPDCSFFVGSWFGAITVAKLIIYGIVASVVIKAINKLIYEPLLEKIKNKIYKDKLYERRK